MRPWILACLACGCLVTFGANAGEDSPKTLVCAICKKTFVNDDFVSQYKDKGSFKRVHVIHAFEKYERYKQEQFKILFNQHQDAK